MVEPHPNLASETRVKDNNGLLILLMYLTKADARTRTGELDYTVHIIVVASVEIYCSRFTTNGVYFAAEFCTSPRCCPQTEEYTNSRCCHGKSANIWQTLVLPIYQELYRVNIDRIFLTNHRARPWICCSWFNSRLRKNFVFHNTPSVVLERDIK